MTAQLTTRLRRCLPSEREINRWLAPILAVALLGACNAGRDAVYGQNEVDRESAKCIERGGKPVVVLQSGHAQQVVICFAPEVLR